MVKKSILVSEDFSAALKFAAVMHGMTQKDFLESHVRKLIRLSTMARLLNHQTK
jgi:hypothetical protein